MATNRKQIRYGSTGQDVKELQTLLNEEGYNLSVDGIWGGKTDAAVRSYQKKNNLTVDGIVGTNTWGSLEKGRQSRQKPPKPSTGATPKSYSDIDLSKYDSGYQKSEDVINAEKKKTDAENAVSNYGDFAYSNQGIFDDVMNKILNREKFSYDLNGDALYQQYKDKYIQQGKMAMQDTIGQASAMTGGYGNSYAATAGNQAYQASLENLNDIVPELYQMAYDKYNQEGQDLYNQYGMLADDRNMEYGIWGDKYNKLVADRDYYGNEANNAYAKDYGEWSDQRDFDTNQYWNETQFGYGQERDKIADEQWQKTFDEGVRQFNEQQALTKEQWAWQKAQAEKAASNNSGGGGKVTVDKNGNLVVENPQQTEDSSGNLANIRKHLDGFTSNKDVESYLEEQEASGAISHEQALQLMSEYMDVNEKYDDDGTSNWSAMVKSTKGWTVVSKGGSNLFGIDKNAKVKAPNGETLTLANLKKKLTDEGMSGGDASSYIKKLQQNLGISSNWFFGA